MAHICNGSHLQAISIVAAGVYTIGGQKLKTNSTVAEGTGLAKKRGDIDEESFPGGNVCGRAVRSPDTRSGKSRRRIDSGNDGRRIDGLQRSEERRVGGKC